MQYWDNAIMAKMSSIKVDVAVLENLAINEFFIEWFFPRLAPSLTVSTANNRVKNLFFDFQAVHTSNFGLFFIFIFIA